jgi:hypothetical protein
MSGGLAGRLAALSTLPRFGLAEAGKAGLLVLQRYLRGGGYLANLGGSLPAVLAQFRGV